MFPPRFTTKLPIAMALDQTPDDRRPGARLHAHAIHRAGTDVIDVDLVEQPGSALGRRCGVRLLDDGEPPGRFALAG